MPHKRPLAVVVLAVLQLVFGVLALANAGFALSGADKALASAAQVNAGQQRLTTQDWETQLEERVPYYGPISRAFAGLSLLLALLMIAGAVGLLRLRPWGWLLSVVYAALSIPYTLAYLAWFLATNAPVLLAYGRELAAAGGQEAEMSGTVMPLALIAGEVLSCLGVAFPVAVLLVLGRRPARAAFGGEGPSAEPEDFRDAPPAGEA